MSEDEIILITLDEVLELINKKYFEASAGDFLNAEDVGARKVCCELEKEIKEKIEEIKDDH